MAPFGDVAPALDVCRVAAAGALLDAVRPLALDALRRIVAAEVAVWVDVDPAGCPVVVVRPEPVDAALLAGHVAHVAAHPSIGAGDGEPAVHRSGAHGVCLALPPPDDHRVGLAVHRSTPFTRAEGDRLDVALPLLGCAVLAARRPPVAGSELLTTREVAVLRSVATGMSDKQAARALGVSPRTVGKHLEHIYAKLGVGGRTEAAAHVGWLPR